MENKLINLPKLKDLVSDNDMSIKGNHLMVLLNQPPNEKWLTYRDGKPYVPIERIEWLLTSIYGRWWTEVKDFKILANSVSVSVRLYVKNPLTNEIEYQDGVGAVPLQTKSGKGAMEWDSINSLAVQMGLPSAKSYAIADAAHCFGKIFGKDVSRKQQIDYTLLAKTANVSYEDLAELFELKKSELPPKELIIATKVLSEKQTNHYNNLYEQLKNL